MTVPNELRAFHDATRVYLSALQEVVSVLEQWADVHRLTEPTFGLLLDEVRMALVTHAMGTPAAVARVTAELTDAACDHGSGLGAE